MRRTLAAALVALALQPQSARAFVPPGVECSCPRAAVHGTWLAYAHTFDGEEMTPHDRVRFSPGRLELLFNYGPPGKKTMRSVLYEVEKPPIACVARSARYEVFGMTWDLELTSNDQLVLRTSHPEKGTHVVRLRRAVVS